MKIKNKGNRKIDVIFSNFEDQKAMEKQRENKNNNL